MFGVGKYIYGTDIYCKRFKFISFSLKLYLRDVIIALASIYYFVSNLLFETLLE